jgi:hypothetical protein
VIAVVVVPALGLVVLRRLVGLVGLGQGPDASDVEIAVLFPRSAQRCGVVGRSYFLVTFAPLQIFEMSFGWGRR